MKRYSVRSRFDHSTERDLTQALGREGAIQSLQLRRVFWLLEKKTGFLRELQLENVCDKVFFDPVSEEMRDTFPEFHEGRTYIEISFLAGVTDNLARTATEALMLYSPQHKNSSWQDFPVEVHSGWEVEISGDVTKEQIQRVLFQGLANSLLHHVDIQPGATLKKKNSWEMFVSRWEVPVHQPRLQLLDLQLEVLQNINQERGLALSMDELQTILAHFQSQEQRTQRDSLGWAGKITEVELECLAQTWSEHCKHKIFAAEVEYSEEPGRHPSLGEKKITSLYKSYIQKATKDLEDCGFLVSVFKDNAGIVDFDSKLNLCIKVETHNSPSALDPFGGAITGILGVNRDILGCGLGAKPVANMDVFCLSTPDLFPSTDSPKRPELLKDPAVIFRGVHQGVEEGGNQSGIPTINGSLCFASEFAAKPLIFVGSVGIMPKTVLGRPSEQKHIRPGDLIVVAGGRLGKDGVHGATFSSLELHDNVASNVVQIGDSITQKRLLDFTLQARDRGWIQAITDNGAGGVSSSIGEMAQLSGGARMDLAKHPLKYAGLEYWEMLVSESQERMSYAVSPKDVPEFLELARMMGVEAAVIGEFTDSGLFEVWHGSTALARLDLHFLHEGLGRMKLKAHFEGPTPYMEFHRQSPKETLRGPTDADLLPVLRKVLGSPNVASKEPLIRHYDHQVQGATRVKPYAGRTQQGANDAGVLDLSVHGGDQGNAVAVANGLCPQFSYYDTYLMAQKAVDEAFRNLVATGADPSRVALVDNFCWPDPLPKSTNPDATHKMAQLVRACEGLFQAAATYRAPFVSGKDSMKNDFIGRTQNGQTVKISVPPTLLVTALAQVPDASKTAPGFFQNAGDHIYLLGRPTESLYGSVLSQQFLVEEAPPEYPDLVANKELYALIFAAHQHSLLASCHDVSDGGLMSAAVECGFGNDLGMQLDLKGLAWNHLWSETGSQFVVSVSPPNRDRFERLFGSWQRPLGRVSAEAQVVLIFNGTVVTESLSELKKVWAKGVTDVYEA